MFSSKEQLLKRTPKDGINREEYINLLVKEFLETNAFDAKCQVLANLSNFAYDPINYVYLRESGVLDLFLNQLTTPSEEKLLHFAVSGICNCCLDPKNADYILKFNGVKLLIELLSSKETEIIINVITILLFLSKRIPREQLTEPSVIKLLFRYKNSANVRLKNLAIIYLEDLCDSAELQDFDEENNCAQDITAIPLPK